jgi:tetratricopeptide (TPR) repeat protein/predicted Ser/Thr protein kinase
LDCPHESTLGAFVDGRLPRTEAAAIEEHARTCPRCPGRIEHARAEASGGRTATFANVAGVEVRPRSGSEPEPPIERRAGHDPELLERGASVGRYTILALVGRGGMGEVYAAYDPELDRKIALKLLRARSSDPRSRARLLREAKAIAKLSHANVVVVHDAGTFDERVFIAMEFVDGETLKEWLAAAPRGRREILDVFASAGRGLEAAHVAGLVHRDFKPHNVMVGKDGSVRVMDFGVARQVDATGGADADVVDAPAIGAGDAQVADAPGDGAGEPPVLGDSPDDLSFTRTGELVGTPLYMAPEQFQAGRTDARTDQFSFCVALYSALYRAHPFGGESIDVLVGRVLTGEVQPPPAKHDVPTWLRRVLLRGLSVSPAARWPSMTALLEALEQDPARARRRRGAAAGIALLVGAAAFTLVRGPRRAESLCRGGPARLAGIWEPPGASSAPAPRPRRDALEGAFGRAGGPASSSWREIWTRVEAGLDRYATSWVGMYREACEATHARGEQSPETLELRMSCLDERRAALGALTNVLASADAATVASAVDAVNALPPVDQCGDIKLLREPTDSPRDEATRARARDIRERLATAKAENDTGHHAEALARVRGLVTEARALGYRSLVAETLEAEGEFQDGATFHAEVIPLVQEAVWTALSVKRDDLAARGAAVLTGWVGYYAGSREEGMRWARLGSALLDRLGPGHDILRAWFLVGEGNSALAANDPEAALPLFREALARKEKLLPPDHPDIAISVATIAETLHRLGKNDDALAMVRRAREIDVRAYGPTARTLPQHLSNEGEYLVALGRAKEAVPLFEDALARTGQVAPDSPILAYPLTGLAQAWLALGRPDEARPLLERALALRATAPNALDLAETRFALARALWEVDKDRPRAHGLAVAARDAYAAMAGDAAKPVAAADAKAQLTAIDAWLTRH